MFSLALCVVKFSTVKSVWENSNAECGRFAREIVVMQIKDSYLITREVAHVSMILENGES